VIKGLDRMDHDPARIAEDLDSCWEVLAEAVQTVMRRYGTADAYEQLKSLTRGERIDQAGLQAFIAGLDIPDAARQNLLDLTPQSYTGLASDLTGQLEDWVHKPD